MKKILISVFLLFLLLFTASCNAVEEIVPEYDSAESASFDFSGEVLAGDFPAKQGALVKAWALLHQDELNANWKLATAGEQIFKINPLQ